VIPCDNWRFVALRWVRSLRAIFGPLTFKDNSLSCLLLFTSQITTFYSLVYHPGLAFMARFKLLQIIELSQQIQNFLARAVNKASKFSHRPTTPILRMNERIKYKILSYFQTSLHHSTFLCMHNLKCSTDSTQYLILTYCHFCSSTYSLLLKKCQQWLSLCITSLQESTSSLTSLTTFWSVFSWFIILPWSSHVIGVITTLTITAESTCMGVNSSSTTYSASTPCPKISDTPTDKLQ